MIAKLAKLAGMISETELAGLARRQSAYHQLQKERATLLRDRKRAGLAQSSDPARFSGSDQRYRRWLDAKLLENSIRSAEAAAALETQRTLAQRAFGRAQALDRLTLRAKGEKLTRVKRLDARYP